VDSYLFVRRNRLYFRIGLGVLIVLYYSNRNAQLYYLPAPHPAATKNNIKKGVKKGIKKGIKNNLKKKQPTKEYSETDKQTDRRAYLRNCLSVGSVNQILFCFSGFFGGLAEYVKKSGILTAF
jgi:hypothetical protein